MTFNSITHSSDVICHNGNHSISSIVNFDNTSNCTKHGILRGQWVVPDCAGGQVARQSSPGDKEGNPRSPRAREEAPAPSQGGPQLRPWIHVGFVENHGGKLVFSKKIYLIP